MGEEEITVIVGLAPFQARSRTSELRCVDQLRTVKMIAAVPGMKRMSNYSDDTFGMNAGPCYKQYIMRSTHRLMTRCWGQYLSKRLPQAALGHRELPSQDAQRLLLVRPDSSSRSERADVSHMPNGWQYGGQRGRPSERSRSSRQLHDRLWPNGANIAASHRKCSHHHLPPKVDRDTGR